MKFITLFFLLLLSFTLSFASEKEDKVKGVILSRISQFITYENGKQEFIICVYDNKEMYESLFDLYKDKEHGRVPIKIVNLAEGELMPKCDIFYVNHPSVSLRKKLKHSPLPYTLLVTDSVEYLDDGFMLALYLQKNKLNIAINQQALLNAHLKVNYRLLKVASKIVNPVKSQ